MTKCLVKRKVTAVLGKVWTLEDVRKFAGLGHVVYVCREICCTGDKDCKARHVPDNQDRIAKALGYSTSELFGPHAWFRLAAAKLQEKIRERKAS